MFKYVLVFAFVAYVSAAGTVSKSDDATAVVTAQKSDVRKDGFDTALDTTNSIHVLSAGDAAGNIKGEFSWISPEGEPVDISYFADASGYHPTGALLPTPPPIPAAILKELDYLSSHPSKEGKN